MNLTQNELDDLARTICRVRTVSQKDKELVLKELADTYEVTRRDRFLRLGLIADYEEDL